MGVHGRGSTNWLRRITKKEKPRLSAEAKPADPTSAMLRHISLITQRMHRSVWSAICTLTTFSNTQAATGRKLYKPTAAKEQTKHALLIANRNRRHGHDRSGSRSSGTRNLPNLHGRNGSQGVSTGGSSRDAKRRRHRRRPTTMRETAAFRSARPRPRAPRSRRPSSHARSQRRRSNSLLQGGRSMREAVPALPALATKRSGPV